MSDRPPETDNNPPPVSGKLRMLFGILPPLLLIGGLVGAVILVKTRPRPERKPPPPMQGLARVMRVQPADRHITLRAMGTVVPAREVALKSQVGGKVVWVHPAFKEGGLFEAGETLLRIEATDYELALARAEGQVARADFEYQLELGYQDVARREWELIQQGRSTGEAEASLALRKPHLASVVAGLASARADLEQARVNLGRTEITAPFNALLLARQVDLGAVVSPQEMLATLVGSDEYWVRVSLPVDRLADLNIQPGQREEGLPAHLTMSGLAGTWTGRVVRLLGNLEESGRMARLLVSVPQPYEQQPQLPLLLGSYLRVDLVGSALEGVYVLPRNALREGDTVWIAGPEDTLLIQPVSLAWKDAESVMVQKGLAPGDRVILSELAIPLPGMPLQVEGDDPAEKPTPPDPVPEEEDRP